MTHPLRGTSLRRRTTVGAGLLAAALCVSTLTATSASAQQSPPPVPSAGAVSSSSNMKLLANIPKSGAFANAGAFGSDLAFKGDYAFGGNYNGFTVYDIKNPRRPREVKQVLCPGSQNDISVFGNLLILSVDSLRTDDSCQSGTRSLTEFYEKNPDGSVKTDANKNPVPLPEAQRPAYWEGIRIFDISNPANPRYLKAVETDCGSHTHTLVPAGNDSLLIYVSSYNPNAALTNCQPPHDKISIVEVRYANPSAAKVIAEPVLFPDGGFPGRPANASTKDRGASATAGCHDITAYPDKGIAAGACMGEGIIMDIRQPSAPKVLSSVRDEENFAFWHSATFNNAANAVMFTDELGGGGGAECDSSVGRNRGANALYSLAAGTGTLTKRSYFKIPREQSTNENCVAHNGSLIPVKGKTIMVQSWYQGGVNVWDWTDPSRPVEIAWFDRGPLVPATIGGSWSAYWHNGYIFSNDIQLGLDVLEVRDRRVATADAGKVRGEFNPQTQPTYRG